MSFFDDAQAFMKQKKSTESTSSDEVEAFLSTEKSREQFAHELRTLYENATWSEIYKAIDWVIENCEPPYDKKNILTKIRIKLED